MTIRTSLTRIKKFHTTSIPKSKPIKLSTRFVPTIKQENLEDYELESQALLHRGGYIRSSSSGIHTLLPNGLRIQTKLTKIIDEELESIGASKVSLPTILPTKLWYETGRYDKIGKELFRLKDRKNTEYLLAPTHEEEITQLISREIESEKQLPVLVYQITRKFRDEPRPRMGLLRSKEFLMKDLYSFDSNIEKSHQTYEIVRTAYTKILDRIFGDTWKCVEADSGDIGGERSHEYHIPDSMGEDTIVYCHCGYAANSELAVSKSPIDPKPRVTLFTNSEKGRLIVVVHGSSLNQTKLTKVVGPVLPASPVEQSYTSLTTVIDSECKLSSAEISSLLSALPLSHLHTHSTNSTHTLTHDIRTVQEGDTCIYCSSTLNQSRSIEIAHAFYLADRYSKPLKAGFYPSKGNSRKAFQMGCYGIGVTRILGTLAIQASKKYKSIFKKPGFFWSSTTRPFTAIIIPTTTQNLEISETLFHRIIQTARHQSCSVDSLLSRLAGNVEVRREEGDDALEHEGGWSTEESSQIVLDDREVRLGVKLADADLTGYGYRLIIGKTIVNNLFELQSLTDQGWKSTLVPLDFH